MFQTFVMAANSINKDLMLLSAIETRWKCWKGVKIVVNANCGVFESCKLKKIFTSFIICNHKTKFWWWKFSYFDKDVVDETYIQFTRRWDAKIKIFFYFSRLRRESFDPKTEKFSQIKCSAFMNMCINNRLTPSY